PIIWDLNMSFGSFRFTDASDNFAGLTVPGCQTVDPLQHFNSVSVYPRPLIRNVMANSTYQRMYLAHLRTIVEENFANGEYYARAEAIQNDISAAVFADTNKFYSDADFTDNLDSTVTDLIEYPGIRDLIEGRTAYLQSYPGMTGAPTLSNAAHSPQSPLVGDDVTITVDHADAGEVWLAWRNGSRSAFQFVQMFDDGQHGDGGANDGTSGFRLTEIGNNVQYYVYAQNDSAGRFLPARAAYEYYAIQPQIGFQDLAINEVMAVNNFTATDPAGQYDDWIELFNNTDFPISTGGMYLSDSAGHLTKWALPDVILPSRGFQIVWADDDTTQSGLHANFKLDGEGDRLYLAYADGTVIDSVVFGRQNFIASYGRDPNGRGAFTEMLPTFDIWNKLTDDEFLTDDLFVFPSPTTADGINYVKVNGEGDFVLSLYSAEGRRVWHDLVLEAGALDRLPTESLRPGIYILKAQQGDTVLTRKFIIHR
ncbi:MAG: lamin tail domain-containing protein, partial [Bacteroidota bacterium]